MEILQESLTKKHREELKGIIATSTQLSRVAMFVIAVAMVSLLFRWLQGQVWSGAPIWVIPAGTFAAWLYLRSGRWTGGPELRRKIREDLEHGNLMVSVLERSSVEEVEELEDEGPSFIVQDKDGSMYLLTGQEMGRYKSKRFPWSKIGVLETPHAKQFFGLRRMGKPICISRKLPPFTYEQAKRLGCLESRFIALDEAKRDLLRET